MLTTQSTDIDRIETFTCSPRSIKFPLLEVVLKNPPPSHLKSEDKTFPMNFAERSLRRVGDNKDFESRSKLQMDTNFRPARVKLSYHLLDSWWKQSSSHNSVCWELQAALLVPISIQTEEFTKFFVTLESSRTLDKRANQSSDVFLNLEYANLLNFSEVSQTNIQHVLVIWHLNSKMNFATPYHRQQPGNH